MKTSTRFPLVRSAWLALAGLGFSFAAEAADPPGASVPFPKVWSLVQEHSAELRAATHELEAARIEESRMSRHWYPRLFAEGRIFSTDDPAVNLMSLLGQRRLGAEDFSPSSLNEPGDHVFRGATLGLELPLYEGGAKVAASRAAAKRTEARSFEHGFTKTRQYAEIASAYSALLSLRKERAELESLARGVDLTLSRYKVGEKSNPVGYSGLLGLRNLRNRVTALLNENAAKSGILRERIRIAAGSLPEHWSPEPQKPLDFLAKHLTPKDTTDSAPAPVLALRALADSIAQGKNAEKARFLPQIGLFGTGNLTDGSRSTGTSYLAGAYLRWDLFSAPNWGTLAQAEHSAAAAKARAEGLMERTLMERSQAKRSVEVLEKNLALMDESARLLQEQSDTSRALFRSGSLNALQLVEVLSRRADLIVDRAIAETELARIRAVLFAASNNEEGALHEN